MGTQANAHTEHLARMLRVIVDLYAVLPVVLLQSIPKQVAINSGAGSYQNPLLFLEELRGKRRAVDLDIIHVKIVYIAPQ